MMSLSLRNMSVVETRHCTVFDFMEFMKVKYNKKGADGTASILGGKKIGITILYHHSVPAAYVQPCYHIFISVI